MGEELKRGEGEVLFFIYIIEEVSCELPSYEYHYSYATLVVGQDRGVWSFWYEVERHAGLVCL